METNTKRNAVYVLSITAMDAEDACLTLLGNAQSAKEITGNNKLASSTLNAFLFDALRGGWLRDDVESFRADVYERATNRGMVVNTKSNSVLTATSRACTLADRADRMLFLEAASSFGEAIKLAKNKDERIAAQEQVAKAAQEAQEQAETAQRKADEAALLVEQSIAEDKASGKYAAELLERIRSMVAELAGLGVSVTLTEA